MGTAEWVKSGELEWLIDHLKEHHIKGKTYFLAEDVKGILDEIAHFFPEETMEEDVIL